MCCCAISAIRRSRFCMVATRPGRPPAYRVTTAVPTPTAKTLPARSRAQRGILVDLQSMKAAVADPNLVKLDTRDVDEWIADFVLALRQGFLPAQGTYPGRGLDRVVPHDEAHRRPVRCSSRARKSSPNAPPSASRRKRPWCSIASRARAPRTRSSRSKKPASRMSRIYFGSWNEWSRDPSLPIETGLPFTMSAAASVAA